ncbi:MAG TPA: HAD family hydrolase [Dehalococcoidales bacterium]|nr:HAD family hydrolase [Dehalococcoidales bacterium]
MKYKAIIFDLGGTLVYSPDYSNTTREMAAVLSAPVEDFVRLWFEQSEGLGTGLFPSYQSYIKHVCAQLEINALADRIDIAASIPFNETKQVVMEPREGAIEVLTYLKSNGYKTGLISDCAPDLPEFWNETPFAPLIDVTVFSCSVGMNKGDPRIFQMAVEELAVEPGNCLYIADGMRQELANATKLGMHALQILVPDEVDYNNPLREEWKGPIISSLKEVLALL